jgi:hypothetical protein
LSRTAQSWPRVNHVFPSSPVTVVRPSPYPNLIAAQSVRPDPSRAAAQRAFFQAARGQVAQDPQPRAEAAALPVQKVPDRSAEPPTRTLRPGSLLDIRV